MRREFRPPKKNLRPCRGPKAASFCKRTIAGFGSHHFWAIACSPAGNASPSRSEPLASSLLFQATLAFPREVPNHRSEIHDRIHAEGVSATEEEPPAVPRAES